MEWDQNEERGQMTLQDLGSQIAPLTIHVVNLPPLVTKEEIAEKFCITQDCITLKQKPGKKTASAIIVPSSWHESDKILSDFDGKQSAFFGKQRALVRQSYDVDTSRPSSKRYQLHKLSNEEFDLSPARSGLPTLHVLHDYVLLHIMEYLSVAEKLTLEAVCRRFQSLVYSMLGQNSVIDFSYCWKRHRLQRHRRHVWKSAHSNLSKCRSKSPVQLTQGLKLCTYKMLIMNATHLTTLRLDEYRCIFDVNVFAAIGQLAVNLEDLCLRFSSKRKHYTSMKTIFSGCSKLRIFGLEGCFNTSGSNELLRDLRQCKCLEVLRLGGITHFNFALLRKLQSPLQELSIRNVDTLSKLRSTDSFPGFPVNSTLTTLRLFAFFSADLEDWLHAWLPSLACKCPALTQLQLDCYVFAETPNFKTFNNLKVLHCMIGDMVEIEVLLKSALPDVEDLYIDFCPGEVHDLLTVDFSLAPTSVKSLTLPSVALDDDSYKCLLRMPKLQRVFVKNEKFSLAQLKLLVAHVQLVEIGAGMVFVNLATAQELTALRRKALAEGRSRFPSLYLDHDQPLVLHVHYPYHAAFENPLIKIKDHKLHWYIYERVGSSGWTTDNEWLDFDHDFLQHQIEPLRELQIL
ncbi:uncharacterized protein LOC108671625 [Hyalella azteca]|uniref:Uncharacterized protein LOC108671625 n=1 Tax=Hyalella azteca TaxID=294128 RepID=A0A979FS70_HYAAZ|nr:uncharacterized protein LOC108671625 [Hyalella azteca]